MINPSLKDTVDRIYAPYLGWWDFKYVPEKIGDLAILNKIYNPISYKQFLEKEGF